jgi:hypothetical protein
MGEEYGRREGRTRGHKNIMERNGVWDKGTKVVKVYASPHGGLFLHLSQFPTPG